MTFIFELHGYRGFRVAANASGAMFTLFFITFGGIANTMPGIIHQHVCQAMEDIPIEVVIDIKEKISALKGA